MGDSTHLGIHLNALLFLYVHTYTFLNFDNPLQSGTPGTIKITEFDHTTHSRSLRATPRQPINFEEGVSAPPL